MERGVIATPLSFLFAKNAKYITRGISNIFEGTMTYEKHEEIFENFKMDHIIRNRCGVLYGCDLYEAQSKEEIVLLLEITQQRRRREILTNVDLG